MPDDGSLYRIDDAGDDDHDDWRRSTTYLYGGRVVTYDALREEVETEAVGLPPEQWVDGEFEFDPWLSDCLLTGHVERVDEGED